MGNAVVPQGEKDSAFRKLAHRRIGASLRSAYSDIIDEPVPDRFKTLLRQLETAQSQPFKRNQSDR